MWYVDKRLSNWNFITYIQCAAGRSNLWFFIHFYYSQIMRTFSRSFYFFLIHIQTFFNGYDVTTSKNYLSNHIPKLYKAPKSKCCEIKIASCKYATFLWNGSPHSIWIFLCRMYLIRETFQRYKTNILYLAFNHAKESVSSKKCS